MKQKPDCKLPKRPRHTAAQERQQAEFDQWLHALDELLSGVVLTAESLDSESRRALGAVFVNKAHDVLVLRGGATIH